MIMSNTVPMEGEEVDNVTIGKPNRGHKFEKKKIFLHTKEPTRVILETDGKMCTLERSE
jgi:hypothetical protein